jgi:serine/threonine-protein kinase
VLSLHLSARCPSCGVAVAVDPLETTAPARCTACATSFPWRPSRAESETIASVQRASPPADVRAFAASHHAPTAPALTPSGAARGAQLVGFAAGARVGRYEIVRRIGMGGMAEVLLGTQRGPAGFAKKVVIKRILPHLAAQSSFVDMFLEEARLAARLDHAHVVQTYDLGKDGDDYFMVMEYVPGADLNSLLKLAKRLKQLVPVPLCCRIVSDICGALQAAHSHRRDDGAEAPILHRDVSPHNVIVALDGRVKLADFGIAKAMDSVQNTESGLLKGKLVYMAPDQLGGAPPEPRMDVYAASLMLYVALTFHHPFHKKSDVQSMRAILAGVLPPIEHFRSDVPKDLRAIVTRGLAPRVEDRFATAEDLQTALETFLEHERQPSTQIALGKWVRGLLENARNARLLEGKQASTTAVTERTAVMTPPEHPREPNEETPGDFDDDDAIEVVIDDADFDPQAHG